MDKIYSEKIKDIVEVAGGLKDGYHWHIYSIKGSHPCAYVVVDKNHPYYQKDFENMLEDIVHGGITYNEEELNDIVKKEDEEWVFGWDYAHSGDFTRLSLHPYSFFMPLGEHKQDWGSSDGKKWTIEEIKEDIYLFVKFLKLAET